MWREALTVGLATLVYLAVMPNLVRISSECVRGHPGPVRNIATKAPYVFLFNDTLPDLASDSETETGCAAKKVWLLARHGTRFPSKAGIRAIAKRLPELAASISANPDVDLCNETIEDLLSWRPDVSLADAKNLHSEGESELLLLAERYQRRLPELLGSTYDQESYLFRATAKQRAQLSQSSFAAGLFGREVAQNVVFETPVLPHDPLIRFYKVCSKWLSTVKHSAASLVERRLFEGSDLVQRRLLWRVSRRLGFDQKLTFEDVDAMYVGCIFGQAWRPDVISPWCNVFNNEEIDILEYREELEHYWQDGPGFNLNGEQACVLVKDILGHFKMTRDQPKGIFYFSHSGAILKLFAFLGLFRDKDHLRHDNFEEMRNRTWRTSAIGGFGANVALVLKECGDGERRVVVTVNERVVPLPGCSGQEFCKLEEFEALFAERVSHCHLERICENIEGQKFEDSEEDRF